MSVMGCYDSWVESCACPSVDREFVVALPIGSEPHSLFRLPRFSSASGESETIGDSSKVSAILLDDCRRALPDALWPGRCQWVFPFTRISFAVTHLQTHKKLSND
jgi:hypothetical protein